MNKRSIVVLISLLVVAVMALSACQPQVVEKTVEVKETVVVEVVQTVVVPEEGGGEMVEDPIAVAKEFLKDKMICAVLPGPVNDAGWTTQAYNGLVNLRDNFGMKILYREETKVEEAEAVMREYAEAGCNIIHAHGFEYADQIDAVAADYPDIQFTQTSRCFGNDTNVIGECFSTGEGGYFLGMEAASVTKTGKIAFIVGTKYPNMDWQPTMAQQAIDDLGFDYKVDEIEVGSWNDPAKAKELTTALIAEGYDVFVMIADAGDTGTVEAIKEAREAGNTDVMAISWVKDKNYLGPEFIAGGWEEMSWKQMENGAVMYALNGAPVGADLPQGVMDGVAKLNPTYGLIPLEMESQVFELFQKYKEEGPSAIPNIQVRTDL
jgi:basic membrane protein A